MVAASGILRPPSGPMNPEKMTPSGMAMDPMEQISRASACGTPLAWRKALFQPRKIKEGIFCPAVMTNRMRVRHRYFLSRSSPAKLCRTVSRVRPLSAAIAAERSTSTPHRALTAASASVWRPRLMSQRGDSFMKKKAMIRGMNPSSP